MVKGLTAQELFLVFVYRVGLNQSGQILVNRGQSEWLARQQGSLFKVNEQDTLYSMCIFEMPHFMER